MTTERALGILEHLASGDALAKEAIEALENKFKRMATVEAEKSRLETMLRDLFRDGCLPEALIPPCSIDRIVLSGHDDDDSKALVRWINAQVPK